jgi:hypothetical protein
MPAFRFAIGRAAESASVQAKNMRRAIAQPGLIDRFELTRMRLVYEETELSVQMCCEQVLRWRDECSTPEQVAELDRLELIVAQWLDDTGTVIAAIKTLLQES